jgi:UDP-glucose:(heptosyl)LPS alpha-1,3-glucosyltransferase
MLFAQAGVSPATGCGSLSGDRKARRIAVLLPRFSLYGGVEQFGFRLAGELARRGHQVDFICARKEAEPPEGVRVLEVGRPPGFRFLKMLWFLIRAESLRRRGAYDLSVSLGKSWRQDVIRVGGGPLKVFWKKSEQALSPGLPRLLKRLRRWLLLSNWLTFLIEQHQFSTKSDVIAVSHLVREWLLQTYPSLSPERITVVYNKPDSTRFFLPTPQERAAARAALASYSANALDGASEPVFIGTASTNFELKGVGPLIRALALLPEHAMLFVAGGRDCGAYIRLAEKLGVAGRVVFCGKMDDMPSFYRGLDIFILPTFYDACSNAVLEALASGCKTLTSSSNGAAFFLEPGAVLADPGDVPEMAKRLRLFMERPAPPFSWPEGVDSGLEAFADHIERMPACARG